MGASSQQDRVSHGDFELSLRKQRECDCCGTFTQGKTLCAQCLHAGCDQRKKGERCYVALGATKPKPHTLPLAAAVAGVVMQAAGKAIGKVEQGIRREVQEVERTIEETRL